MQQFDDPSIERAAVQMAASAWDEIEGMTRAGIDFYRARELVCARSGPQWKTLYGAQCAGQALRMIHAMDPASRRNFSPETRAVIFPRGRADDWIAAGAILAVFLMFPSSLIAYAFWWFGINNLAVMSLFLFSGIGAAALASALRD